MTINIFRKKGLLLFLTLCGLYSFLHGREPIEVNLIIDCSEALAPVKGEITTWLNQTVIDQMLLLGDKLIVWNAGSVSKMIFSDTLKNEADRENLKNLIRELQISGSAADLSGALKEAAGNKPSGLSYTLLVSTAQGLTGVLSGPQAHLLRYSRITEFSKWRVVVVGLDLNTKVKNAARAYFGN
jgi:hypothetical protein